MKKATRAPKESLAAVLAAVLMSSALTLMAACEPKKQNATSAQASDQDISDAYIYLLGRLLVLRQERLDFETVQSVFRGHNKPKFRRHNFAFGGLLHCAHDNCMVTAELKKNRHIYYRCTGYRGKCALPYLRKRPATLGDHS